MENKEVKKQFIASMTTSHLLVELMGLAVADLYRADAAMQSGDYETVNAECIHAQNVLAELQATLKRDDDHTQQAVLFLDCLLEQLFYANINNDRRKLMDATHMLERLKIVYELNFDPREP